MSCRTACTARSAVPPQCRRWSSTAAAAPTIRPCCAWLPPPMPSSLPVVTSRATSASGRALRSTALNAHVRAGKPIAGTSAGLAILGGYAYGAMDGGSITSAGALADPMGSAVTMDSGFLQMPYLQRVVTDTHFDKRDRLGRLIVFGARRPGQWRPGIVGIGVDEDTALCVEPDGQAQVYSADGEGKVWVVSPGRDADRLVEGEPLRFHAVPVTVVASGSRMRLDDSRPRPTTRPWPTSAMARSSHPPVTRRSCGHAWDAVEPSPRSAALQSRHQPSMGSALR